MTDGFSKNFDGHQHSLLRARYGDIVPPLEMISVRMGLYGVIDSLFAALDQLPAHRGFRVERIESRSAGFLVVTTSGFAGGAGDVIYVAEEEARQRCEHCGSAAAMIVKVGIESLLSRPDVELGDRLLCVDCAAAFREHVE